MAIGVGVATTFNEVSKMSFKMNIAVNWKSYTICNRMNFDKFDNEHHIVVFLAIVVFVISIHVEMCPSCFVSKQRKKNNNIANSITRVN